ncbi:MAG: hypothetical protein R3A47_11670 [Polyangiales bacterium]
MRDYLERFAEAQLFDITDSASDERFFALCPDAQSLFGKFSRHHMEQMVNETIVASYNLVNDEPFLDALLHAMGGRHRFFVRNTGGVL